MPNIYEYLDYRLYLRDFYNEKKEKTSYFSHRYLAKACGFKSSNFLKFIMDGERNLSQDGIRKLSKGMKLNKGEREFFENLVLYNQADSHEEKKVYYENLIRSRSLMKIKPLAKDQYDFYAEWFHPAVRELIVLKDFNGTPEWIAKNLSPSITVSQAKRSLELLERLDLIKKTGPNKWEQTESLITTGPEASSLMVLSYHQNLLRMMADVIPEIESENRDVSAINCSVPKDMIPKIKKKIQDFRQEILKMITADEEAEEAVLLTMQLLPLTRSNGEDSK